MKRDVYKSYMSAASKAGVIIFLLAMLGSQGTSIRESSQGVWPNSQSQITSFGTGVQEMQRRERHPMLVSVCNYHKLTHSAKYLTAYGVSVLASKQ